MPASASAWTRRCARTSTCIARTFAINNVGLAATFHPFVAADGAARQRRAWWASPASPASAACRGTARYCASKAAVISYCESLRGELRGSGVQVVTICAGLRRHAADAAEPLRHAVPDAAGGVRRCAPSAPSRRARSYRVIPWQMGVVAKLLRVLPERRCSTGCWPGRPRKHGGERAIADAPAQHEKGSRRSLLHCVQRDAAQ